MRHDIEIYAHFEQPLPLADLQTRVLERDFSARCTPKDRENIQSFWDKVIKPKHLLATSEPRGRANLVGVDQSGQRLTFEYVEYKEYLAVSRTGNSEPKPLSAPLYETMRIAAIGVALILPDNTVLVHRRPYTATHVAGVFDCSTAGVLPLDAQGVYTERGLHEKLKRELGLNPEDVTIVGATGIHSAGSPDFSGLITTVLQTHLKKEEIEQRMKPGIFPEIRYIPRAELADFVIERYLKSDMNHDGAMTLLSSLPLCEWEMSIRQLQKAGKNIVYTQLAERQTAAGKTEDI